MSVNRDYRDELERAHGDPGAAAADAVDRWCSGTHPLTSFSPVEEFVERAPLDLLHDSFWRQLPFGTGGIRGTVGVGPNRINATTVGLTIQAHCDVLDGLFGNGSLEGRERAVVIANDVREFRDHGGTLAFLDSDALIATPDGGGVSSRSMAHLAARIYAANGFTAYMIDPGSYERDRLLTTPELSFLIRAMRCCSGINLSASHNPRDDNGVKLYDDTGGQYLPPEDEYLSNTASEVSDVRETTLDDAVERGLVRAIPDEDVASYRRFFVDRARTRDLASRDGTKILFTPLAGCGERTVGAVLPELGYDVHVPPAEGPDPTFSAIPLRAPNPEVDQATANAKDAADGFGADLVLASDPDADRLGVEVRHQGRWVHLTGNQIGTVLAYRLLADPDGPRLRGGVYETLVTTLAVSAIATRAGCEPVVDDLLVGFKYIGKAIRDREARIGSDDDDALVSFAAEESHGFLDNPHMRDKDAMSGALYLAKLHEELARDGRTLVDYLEAAYGDVGRFGDRGRSVLLRGSSGVHAISDAMAKLRSDPPRSIGAVEFESVTDFRDSSHGEIRSNTDAEARNVLVLAFPGGRVTLRPSGTEPKLKLYVQTRAQSADDPQRFADDLGAQVYTHLVERLGYRLDPQWAALPDIVPLSFKVELQDTFLPELRRRLGGEDPGDTAQWLSGEVGRLIEGGDPEVVGPAVRESLGDDAAAAEAFEGVLARLGSRGGKGSDA